MKDNATPRDFLRRFYELPDAVSPLADLARLQPTLLPEIIELAMVMGIHAQERRATEPDIRPINELIGSTIPWWRGGK